MSERIIKLVIIQVNWQVYIELQAENNNPLTNIAVIYYF